MRNSDNLDNPFVVHKVTDASYEDVNASVDVENTHIDESEATLERHRFKKNKKKRNNKPIIIVVTVIIITVLITVLYKYGYFDKLIYKQETTTIETTTSYVSTTENKYANTITVKGTYIFYEGVEVDGIQGLIDAIKYDDEGKTFIVQDVDADMEFMNEEVIHSITSLGFNYELQKVISTDLISSFEKNATTTTTTTEPSTTNDDSYEE